MGFLFFGVLVSLTSLFGYQALDFVFLDTFLLVGFLFFGILVSRTSLYGYLALDFGKIGSWELLLMILGLVELMCLGLNNYRLVKSTLIALLICFQDFILPGHVIGVHTILGVTLNYCNLFSPFPIYSDFWGKFFFTYIL